jgi:hypothetical protein
MLVFAHSAGLLRPPCIKHFLMISTTLINLTELSYRQQLSSVWADEQPRFTGEMIIMIVKSSHPCLALAFLSRTFHALRTAAASSLPHASFVFSHHWGKLTCRVFNHFRLSQSSYYPRFLAHCRFTTILFSTDFYFTNF